MASPWEDFSYFTRVFDMLPNFYTIPVPIYNEEKGSLGSEIYFNEIDHSLELLTYRRIVVRT